MKVKLSILALFACSLSLFAGCSNNDHKGLVPDQAIVQAFNTKYPNATKVEWENKADYKVADFYMGSHEMEAWFDNNGNWVMTETDITYNELPAAVRTGFESSQYADWKKEDIDKLERVNTATLYIIEVEKGKEEADLHYAENGTLVKVVTDTDNNNDNNYQPVQLSKVIQDFLDQKYPGATLLDIDKESYGTEVDILYKGSHKEVKFDTNGAWISSNWDITAREVPTTIMDALATSQYNQYRIDDIEALEKPDGMFYVFELEYENNEVTITFNSEAQVIIHGK